MTPPPLDTLGSLQPNATLPKAAQFTIGGLKAASDACATAQAAAPTGVKHGLHFGLSAFVESKRVMLHEPSSVVGYVTSIIQGCVLPSMPWLTVWNSFQACSRHARHWAA